MSGAEEAQMAALGLPTEFARKSKPIETQVSSLPSESAGVGRSNQHTPSSQDAGWTGRKGYPDGQQHVSKRANAQDGGFKRGNRAENFHNKRSRDNTHRGGNASAKSWPKEHYSTLPLEEIPTESLIRRSFTEDPWANLS